MSFFKNSYCGYLSCCQNDDLVKQLWNINFCYCKTNPCTIYQVILFYHPLGFPHTANKVTLCMKQFLNVWYFPIIILSVAHTMPAVPTSGDLLCKHTIVGWNPADGTTMRLIQAQFRPVMFTGYIGLLIELGQHWFRLYNGLLFDSTKPFPEPMLFKQDDVWYSP